MIMNSTKTEEKENKHTNEYFIVSFSVLWHYKNKYLKHTNEYFITSCFISTQKLIIINSTFIVISLFYTVKLYYFISNLLLQ